MTFFRLPDHQRGDALIERDDGVVYRLDGTLGSAEPPHDLVHYTVEDALGMRDGLWGAIAGGVVFRSMRHVSGRRPPHAAERSRELIRLHRDLLRRAEFIGGICERAAALPDRDLDRFLAGLSAPPIGPERVATAAAALRRTAGIWAGLAVGDRLTLEWPAHRRMTGEVMRQRYRAPVRPSR